MVDNLIERYPKLACVKDGISAAYTLLETTYLNGGKVLCCGNGGSCADADHIVGELMKSFKFKRKISDEMKEALSSLGYMGDKLALCLEGALPAISLNSHNALSSAYINDTDSTTVYAQLLYGFGKTGDTLITLTTSGNSANCLYAAVTAKAMGINVIAMTGQGGGKIADIADVTIKVPEQETYLVQELHLPIYHCLCAMLEERFF
jgi:Phosphoheptose isomerase